MKIAANGELAPLFTWRSLCLLSEADVRGRIAEDTPSKLEDVRLSREIAREAGCLDGPYPFRAARTAWAVWQGKAVWPEQEMYDDTWGEILLLCGLPGTGKDTFARQSALPAVSLDDTRRRMGVRREDEQGTVIQAAKEEARKYLRGRQPFVWNATCLTRKNRSELTRLFESYGARVRIVYLETDWEENLRRNRDREAAVPESALGRMLDKLEPPERNEAQAVEWRTV